jgi:hypothetical protein
MRESSVCVLPTDEWSVWLKVGRRHDQVMRIYGRTLVEAKRELRRTVNEKVSLVLAQPHPKSWKAWAVWVVRRVDGEECDCAIATVYGPNEKVARARLREVRAAIAGSSIRSKMSFR